MDEVQGATPEEQNPASVTPTGTPAAPVTPATGAPAPVDNGLSIGDDKPKTGSETADGSSVQYEPTGDVGLDIALEFIGERGFGPEHPAVAAAINGDFAPLEAALGAMGDKAKGFERMLALAKGSYEKQANETKARQEADLAAIHKVAGSKEQWDAIRAWAGENAEPAEKAAVNAALQAGGLQAKAMAAYLASLFNNAPSASRTPTNPVEPGTSGRAPGAEPLSAQGYAQAVQQLQIKLGNRFEGSAEYRALQARRAAARAAGY